MATLVGKVATKKLLTKQFAPSDPYYETYSDDKGKQKRRKRALPPGLSKRDAAILRSVRRRAHHLDEGFQICGMEFGWTFFVGIIPVVGDLANLALNHSFVVKKAKKAEIPASLLRDMQMRNLISTGMGMIPAVGDICVAIYKPNSRNAAMLEGFLRTRGEEALRLNPPVDGQSSTSVLSGETGRSWFRRKPKGSGQVNSATASGANTPSGPNSTGASHLMVDGGGSTSRIPSSSSWYRGR